MGRGGAGDQKQNQSQGELAGQPAPAPAGKASIAKEKLCDEEFDKLVIDTSFRVSQQAAEEDCPEEVATLEEAAGRDQEDEESVVNFRAATNPVYNRLNQPKRPMNAFMVWGQAIRRNLHLRFSNVQNALLSKALGRVWRSLEASQKEPYVRRANLIKANHKRDYPDYRYQPRRIQERRNKSNVLIGISLKHPVNEAGSFSATVAAQSQPLDQYPGPVSRGAHHQAPIPAGHHQFSHQFEQQQHHHHPQHHHHHHHHHQLQQQHGHQSAPANLLPASQLPEAPGYACNLMSHEQRQLPGQQQQQQMVVKEGKTVEGAQTFEYQPYPATGRASSAGAGSDQHSASFSGEPIVCQAARSANADYAITSASIAASHNNATSSTHHLYNSHQQQQQEPAGNPAAKQTAYAQLPGSQANYSSYQQPAGSQFSTYNGINHPQDHSSDLNNYHQFNHHHHHQQQLAAAAAVSYQDNTGLKVINNAINNYYEIASMTNMTE